MPTLGNFYRRHFLRKGYIETLKMLNSLRAAMSWRHKRNSCKQGEEKSSTGRLRILKLCFPKGLVNVGCIDCSVRQTNKK